MSKTETNNSKFLSFVLRHKPEAIGLHLSQDGWASIEDLIECAGQNGHFLTREMIDQIVDTSDKKRFSLSACGRNIRASQGHTAKAVKIEFECLAPPEILFHGTASRFLDSIMDKGLVSGARHHVHLSELEATAIEVGMRYGKPVVLVVQARKMQDAGIQFYRSENGVWLTEAVPSAYIHVKNPNVENQIISSQSPEP